MDTLLKDGQHFTQNTGLPQTISGTDEIIQQALIRLSVKKGSFPYDKNLGSELYKLHKSSSTSVQREAMSYVQEALQPVVGLEVTAVKSFVPSADILSITATLKYKNNIFDLEVI